MKPRPSPHLFRPPAVRSPAVRHGVDPRMSRELQADVTAADLVQALEADQETGDAVALPVMYLCSVGSADQGQTVSSIFKDLS